MEGLIPLVYRTIKRSNTRRRYECLSFGVANTYNIENFYPNNPSKQYEMSSSIIDDRKMVDSDGGDNSYVEQKQRYYRRTQSLHVEYIAGVSQEDKQIVKFRSHRRMFSCVTGG
ncbi:unnamed protein product [Withania somnifera]